MQVVKIWRVLFVWLMLWSFINARGQELPYLERPITIHASNVTVATQLNTISVQAGVVFSYTQPFNDQKICTLNCDRWPLRKVLDELLTPLNCSYVLKDKYVIIKNDMIVASTPSVITGYIYNVMDSTSISEASVYVTQTKHSTVTNNSGYFTLSYTTDMRDVKISFAKEDYHDTSVVVYNKKKAELYVYLFPKQLSSDNAALVVSPFVGDSVISINTDSLTTPLREKNNFWNRFRASHPNIRNISDTLFNHLSVSLIPTISTNKELSINTVNEYSLNILVGQSKGVTKCEVGWLLNIDNGDVQWAQVAWGGNIVSGNVSGGQSANLFNSVSGNVLGGQVGGIINLDRGNLKGGQGAGIINMVRGDIEGGQGAGILNIDKGNIVGGAGAGVGNVIDGNVRGGVGAGVFNINKKEVVGAQVAGIFNKATYVYGSQTAGVFNQVDSIRGFQIAGVCNLSRYNSGFQLAGILNRASYLKGSQLALINVVDSCDGVPIGVLSYVNHGYHKLEFTTDEMGFVTAGFKTGVKSFHNTFFAGGNYSYSDVWSYGYALGSSIRMSPKTDLTLALSTQQIQKFGASEINLNLLNRFYLGFDCSISKKFGFSIGPSFNLMISDVTDADYTSTFDKLMPYTFYNQTNNSTNVKMWVGGQLSVRMF